MAKSRARPRKRADAERNRERVLEAVFALTGDLRDLSLDDIARQARVGRSTLYRHFATRDELLVAANLRAIEEGREMGRAVVAAGGTAREIFERLGHRVVELAGRFRVLRAHRDVAARLVAAGGDDALTAWIADAHARGELRQELSPRWIADMMIVLSMASADQLAQRDASTVGAMLGVTMAGAFVAPKARLGRRGRRGRGAGRGR